MEKLKVQFAQMIFFFGIFFFKNPDILSAENRLDQTKEELFKLSVFCDLKLRPKLLLQTF